VSLQLNEAMREKFDAALNCSLVQELSAKNDQLTTELQKLRTAVNTGMFFDCKFFTESTGENFHQ